MPRTIMIEKFIRIHLSVNYAFIDLNLNPFIEPEINSLKLLGITLQRLVLATKELSKNSATLLEAEATYKFLNRNLSKIMR